MIYSEKEVQDAIDMILEATRMPRDSFYEDIVYIIINPLLKELEELKQKLDTTVQEVVSPEYLKKTGPERALEFLLRNGYGRSRFIDLISSYERFKYFRNSLLIKICCLAWNEVHKSQEKWLYSALSYSVFIPRLNDRGMIFFVILLLEDG